MADSIVITAMQADELQAHSRACWPREACALLVGAWQGHNCRVDEVVCSANIAADPQHFFEIDPAVRIRTEVRLRGTDRGIVGVFHTHPDGPARPSAADARMVIETGFIWLVAAAQRSGITEMAAYRPRPAGGGFDPVALSAPQQNNGETHDR
jgi:proteasome lid subunit RPN8/RPN11